jgi:YfiH family protein
MFSASSMASSVPPLHSATIAPWSEAIIAHGFMSRTGGVSAGAYASFNLAEWTGDDPAAVRENWARWHETFPRMRVARLAQVHGNLVHRIGADHDGSRPNGDGMVTAESGIALGVFSADCVPILLFDADAGVVGALHAGWRGTIANIAAEGVRAMAALGAHSYRIRAAMGPSIGQCCFEVNADLATRFAHEIHGAEMHARPGRPGKSYLDLRGIIAGQLRRAGLAPTAIANIGPCTRCANNRYFSRRSARGATTGLQMSFIGFRP